MEKRKLRRPRPTAAACRCLVEAAKNNTFSSNLSSFVCKHLFVRLCNKHLSSQRSLRGNAHVQAVCCSTGVPAVRGIPPPGVGVSAEMPAASISSPRRGRVLQTDGASCSGEGKQKRSRSKAKGWGGVGRWMRGVYGSSSHRHHHSRSHREPSPTIPAHAMHYAEERLHSNEEYATERRETPRRSLRFAI